MQDTSANSCRICVELDQFLHSAQQPDSPQSLVGLSEAAERNRLHQRQERIDRAQNAIERHKNVCVGKAKLAASL